MSTEDLLELQSLRAQATRSHSQNVLDTAIRTLKSKLDEASRLERVAAEKAARAAERAASGAPKPALPTVKITNYGWDQSDKFVKLYLTLNGVHSLPADQIASTFTRNSFEVSVSDLNGKNYSMTVKGLLHPIDPDNSLVKQKSDTVVVMLRKGSASGEWEALTQLAKDAKDKTMPKLDGMGDGGDPQESLMNMMKQMYESGDDEMKRSIRKAYHEGQSGKAGGMGGGMSAPDMPSLHDL